MRRLVALILMLAGAWLALLPQGLVAADLGTGVGDKPAHAMFAAVVAWLLMPPGARSVPLLASVVALVLLLAGALEAIQPLAGRGAELSDWLAAGVGVMFALVAHRSLQCFVARTRA